MPTLTPITVGDNNSPENFSVRPATDLTPVDSNKQVVSVTDTREMSDNYQQHIDDLNNTIAELKSASEKENKKNERIIRRLRFRLNLLSIFWVLTVLILSSVFGWFAFRWYNELQLQKQLATFSPERVQDIQQIRNEIKELNKTLIPQLQTEIKRNQEEMNNINTKIDKSQESISVLIKAMEELKQQNKSSSSEASEESKSEDTEPNSN